MIKICDMTSRSYFGKMNSILGSVVPLAMFTFLLEKPNKIWHNGKFVGLFQLVPLIYFQKSKFNFKVFFIFSLCCFPAAPSADKPSGIWDQKAARLVAVSWRGTMPFLLFFFFGVVDNMDILTSKAKYGTKKRHG